MIVDTEKSVLVMARLHRPALCFAGLPELRLERTGIGCRGLAFSSLLRGHGSIISQSLGLPYGHDPIPTIGVGQQQVRHHRSFTTGPKADWRIVDAANAIWLAMRSMGIEVLPPFLTTFTRSAFV